MSWTNLRAAVLRGALMAAAAALSGCNQPAGESELVPLFGESVGANVDLQTGWAGTARRIARDFAAAAEPTVTFAFDDASLDAGAQAALDRQASWLRAHPGVPMMIVGHADLVGSERYNFGLGLRRAESARDYLIARGISSERLVAVESRGEQDPVVPTAERERRNRRAVTVVAGAAGAGGRSVTGLDGTYAARIYDAYQAGGIRASEVEAIAVN